MAWAPLAEGKNNLFNDSILSEIGEKYGKTAAQVALKFLVSEDIIIIPKSVHKERMAENLAIEDFSLIEREMQIIRTMDTGHTLIADFSNPALAKFLLHYED